MSITDVRFIIFIFFFILYFEKKLDRRQFLCDKQSSSINSMTGSAKSWPLFLMLTTFCETLQELDRAKKYKAGRKEQNGTGY